MADQQPHAAGDQPVQPRLHNRRRQRNGGNRHRVYRLSAEAFVPANQRTAMRAEDVDGWTVTQDVDRSLDSSLCTADRRVFEQVQPAQPPQDYPTCLLCCETFKVQPLWSTQIIIA